MSFCRPVCGSDQAKGFKVSQIFCFLGGAKVVCLTTKNEFLDIIVFLHAMLSLWLFCTSVRQAFFPPGFGPLAAVTF